jgi:hypothetical protein
VRYLDSLLSSLYSMSPMLFAFKALDQTSALAGHARDTKLATCLLVYFTCFLAVGLGKMAG